MAKTTYSDKKLREPVKKRLADLRKEAVKFYPAWRDLSDYLNPTRGFFDNKLPDSHKKIDHSKLIDDHATLCIRDSASGMISGLTSPSRPWFKLGLPDLDLERYGPVAVYLDECTRRMLDVASRSNIYDCFHAGYEEIITFGTNCMLISEDFEDVIRGRLFTIGEYFLSLNAECRMNGFGRQFWMTVWQAVNAFGFDNCSTQIRTAYKNNDVDKLVLINHLIEENDDRIEGIKDFYNMPYRSIYWENGAETEQFLRLSGYQEFPVIASRWATTTSADVYGRSPGWHALGNVKMLQEMQKKSMIGIDKSVDPPLQADATVDGIVNSLPGGLTRTSGNTPNTGVRTAYEVRLDIGSLEAKIEKVKYAISQAFYSDLFKMLIQVERGQMTATEVAERQAEKLSMLSPVVEKLNNEQNNPFIGRLYAIMDRLGLLPEPPEEIQGMPLRVQYVSTLAQASRMVGIRAIEQNVAFIGGMGNADPSVLFNLNADETAQEYARMLGVPAKTMNPPEVVAAMKAEAAKQAQQQQLQQQLLMAADTAPKLGKAIRDAGAINAQKEKQML